MELNDAIRKINALRALSARAGTDEEAAAAAGKAATLIAQYELDEAALSDAPDEPVGEQSFDGSNAKRREAWKGVVASAVGRAHGCRVYSSYLGGFRAIGRKRDISAAAYQFGLIVEDIKRLAEQGWRAAKPTAYESAARWRNGFKLGAASKISTAIRESIRKSEVDRRAMEHLATPETARALVVIRKRQSDVDRLAAERGIRTGRRTRTRSASGYAAGRAASVNVGGNAVASLGGGRGQVTA